MKRRRAFSLVMGLLVTGLTHLALGAGSAPGAAYGTAPVADYATFGDYGVVLGVTEGSGDVTIVAEGRYGYHMDEDPAMTLSVAIDQTGTIGDIALVDARNQTQGFAEMITDDYLKGAYVGKPAAPTMEVDAYTGATVTSKAVLYAVQAAANYAQQVYGYVADTGGEDAAELNGVYPAQYTAVESSADIDAKKLGTVLYAARGTAADGREVVAMKVQSGKRPKTEGSANTGWDAAVPGAFTMIIVVDEATDQVVEWSMVKDGTRRPEFFAIPAETIDAYREVTVSSPEAFDDFTGGLVFDLEFDKEKDAEGYDVITGTSVVYTGATTQGTFSSQMIRLCFMTAARFYCGLS